MHPETSCKLPAFVSTLALLVLACVVSSPCFGQSGKWDEVVGKKVINNQGATLGYVRDTVIDLENNRYVGVLVAYGGTLGLGEKMVLVPSMALTNPGIPRTLTLNMDVDKFHNAPLFQMSQQSGPAAAAKLAEIYRYYGLQPYFGGTTGTTLHYLQPGSRILLMPVDNLEGKCLGWVYGLRGLELGNESFKGVVITPRTAVASGDYKLVQPEDLQYNDQRTRLRLKEHDQVFHDSPNFSLDRATGHYKEEVRKTAATPAPVAAVAAPAATPGATPGPPATGPAPVAR